MRLSNLDLFLDQCYCLLHLGNHRSWICASFSFSFTGQHHYRITCVCVWRLFHFNEMNKSRILEKWEEVNFFVCAVCSTQFSYKVAAAGRISISRSRASVMDRSSKIFLLSFALLIWVNIVFLSLFIFVLNFEKCLNEIGELQWDSGLKRESTAEFVNLFLSNHFVDNFF